MRLELTVPFARVGGHVLAVKGERAEQELAAEEGALRTLHVELERSERRPSATLLLFVKRRATLKGYPRRAGEPNRKPL